MDGNGQLILELQQQIKELRLENHGLQSSCFAASETTTDAQHEEQKKISQLQQDINAVQQQLHAFAFVKGRSVIINERAADDLFNHYYTSAFGTKMSKNHLSAALQRHLAEIMLDSLTNGTSGNSLFMHDLTHISQESAAELEISVAADKLMDLMSNLRPRGASNALMKATIRNIRKEVFSTINAYTVDVSGKVVKDLHERLLKEMDKYRTTLVSPDKISNDAKNLVEKMVSLFYRLKGHGVQEVRFVAAGTKLDRRIMDAGYLDDDEDYDFQVDLCYFPLIVSVGNDGEEHIISKASVLLRPRGSNSQIVEAEDFLFPLANPVVDSQQQRSNNSQLDGYDILQPMTGCWRSGSSNCEPEKASLRKERDEWKEKLELLQEEFEAYKEQSQKKIEPQDHEERKKLETELALAREEIESLKMQAEEQSLREKEQAEHFKQMESKHLETQSQLDAQIAILNEQIRESEHEIVNYAEQQERLYAQLTQRRLATNGVQSPGEKLPSQMEDDFVLVE